MIFHENRLLTDDSHEIYLFLLKTSKDVAKFVVCSVVIGALKIKVLFSGDKII